MHKIFARFFVFLWITAVFTACTGPQSYSETFDAPGSWRVESSGDVEGEVHDGVYDFIVHEFDLTSWTTAGQSFSDGIYSVEATQVAGPPNNAFGMLFRVDDEEDNFYSFQISGDGFVWIGKYEGGISEVEPIVDDWWFKSPVINQGHATNKLSVQAEGQNLIFFVNDQEVGRVTDDAFSRGDIGLMVRTLGEGGVQVQFDNFTVEPLP
ncbi:hypothetical protein [Candidatus Leptofilum sp.]|uniref:hypothetical protein n=1 Tax=Candidatus Leptofilum sp. TaxID=3241576 RepID=UPI003B5C8880